MEDKKELLIRGLKGRADVYNFIGKYDNGIEDCKKAISLCKKEIPNSDLIAEAKLCLADIIGCGKSDYKHAEEVIKEILKNPNKKVIYSRGLVLMGVFLRQRGDYIKAMQCFQKALKIYEKLNYQEGIASVSNNIGLSYYNIGKYNLALKYLKKCLNISRKLSDKMKIGVACGNIGLVYSDKMENRTAFKYYREYLNISQEIGYKRGVAIALSNIAFLYEYEGDIDKSLEYYKRSLFMFEKMGNKRRVGMTFASIGIIHYYKGDFDLAFIYFKKSLDIFERIKDKRGCGISYTNIGKIYMEKGDFNSAKENLQKAEKILTELGDKIYLFKVYIILSELNTKIKYHSAILEFAQKAYSIADKIGSKKEKISALRAMGKALFFSSEEPVARAKRKEIKKSIITLKAVSYIKKSVLLAKKLNMKLEYAISLYELGKILLEIGKVEEGKKHLKTAQKIFKKAGAKLWLKKVKDLM